MVSVLFLVAFGKFVLVNGEWLMVKESLRKFASGSAEDTGKCYGFLLDSFRKVCVREW